MAVRPYIQKTIVELQAIFEDNKSNRIELKKLAAELSHRKVPKGVALAKKIKDSLSDANSEEYKEFKEPQKTSEPRQEQSSKQPDDPIIDCQVCGQKLRINLSTESREFNCPSCKANFNASFSNGVLSVVFVNKSTKGTETEDLPINLKEAYKLFGADESSPWEMIELSRRRLIQQYHPDKVAALGPKLRAVAELEGKRINLSYALLRQAKGL